MVLLNGLHKNMMQVKNTISQAKWRIGLLSKKGKDFRISEHKIKDMDTAKHIGI